MLYSKVSKYLEKFTVLKSYAKILFECQDVKRVTNCYFKISSWKYFNSKKFISVYNKPNCNYVVPTKNQYFCNKKLAFFSSILTYLGLKKEEPESKESELIMTIKRGILLIQRKEFDKAEQMLHLALKMAQELNDTDGVTYVYDVLANLAFETNQHKKAEKLFVSVLQRLLVKGEPQDSNKVVHISLKLAKIFEDTNDYKKAEQGYNFCIETLNPKLQDGDEDTLALYGMSMDWYAKFLLNNNRKNEALACLKNAYEICVKINGVENEQSVVLLNDLGTISSLSGDNDSALSYLEEARDIGKKLPEMKDLASIYVNLGQIYLLKEMYKESKKACEEGLKKARDCENDVASSEALQCLEKINKAFKNHS